MAHDATLNAKYSQNFFNLYRTLRLLLCRNQYGTYHISASVDEVDLTLLSTRPKHLPCFLRSQKVSSRHLQNIFQLCRRRGGNIEELAKVTKFIFIQIIIRYCTRVTAQNMLSHRKRKLC